MASLAAVRYSQALFELGKEENKLDVFKKDLMNVDEVLIENEELSKMLKHPKIEKSERKELLLKVFPGVDPLVSNFLRLLVDNGRIQSIVDISKYYVKLFNQYHDIEIAYIYSAQPLSKEEVEDLKAMLEKKTNKTIETKLIVDRSLLAGVRIKINGEVLDNSVESQLNRMQKQVMDKAL